MEEIIDDTFDYLESPPPGAFFKIAMDWVDRGLCPKGLDLSEDAFRLLIYQCAAVNTKTGTHHAGPKAAKTHVDLEADVYRAAQDELIRNGLTYPSQTLGYWFISDPPLVDVCEDGSTFRLYRPDTEPQTWFHRRGSPFRFIRVPRAFV